MKFYVLLSLFIFASLFSTKSEERFDIEILTDTELSPSDIPPINKPIFEMHDGSNQKQFVIGISYNEVQKAYPINIMNYHQVVNDYFGDVPVSITYSPLSGSPVAFIRKIQGNEAMFASVGKLYNSHLVFYELETKQIYSQLYGKSISVGNQNSLQMIKSDIYTLEAWLEIYPNSLILTKNTGFYKKYDKNPYEDYKQDTIIRYPVQNIELMKLPAKTMCYFIKIGSNTKIYPINEMEKSGANFENEFAGNTIKISYDIYTRTADFYINGVKLLPIRSYYFAINAIYPKSEIYLYSN